LSYLGSSLWLFCKCLYFTIATLSIANPFSLFMDSVFQNWLTWWNLFVTLSFPFCPAVTKYLRLEITTLKDQDIVVPSVQSLEWALWLHHNIATVDRTMAEVHTRGRKNLHVKTERKRLGKGQTLCFYNKPSFHGN
jgi:hypothetical protein